MPPVTLKILLVAHGLPPESVGGVEQHVEGLARALVRKGHDVTVYARTPRDGEQGLILEEAAWGCRVFRVVYRHEGLTSLADLYRDKVLDHAFARFLGDRLQEGQRFDVAHVHHLSGVSVAVVDQLQTARIPVALTLHDYWLMCPRGQMWHRREEACERAEPGRCGPCLQLTFPAWFSGGDGAETQAAALHRGALDTLARTDLLIAPSSRVVPFFARLGVDPARFRVVRNGVDAEALAGVPPPPPQGPLRVGYLGTLIPSKGLHVLKEAFLAVWGRFGSGCSLDIHGNAVSYHGDDTYLRRVFGDLPEGAPIHYHGPYATRDLPRILAGIDVLVAPALWAEAFGLTPREALAAGRPVICSRIGGLQDAVSEDADGLLVPPGDAGALAGALARLAGDRSHLLKLAAGARRRAGHGFDAMAAELVDLYRTLA